MGKRIPDVIRERILKLAKEGSSTREISIRTGVSICAVRKLCHKAGVEPGARSDGTRYMLTTAQPKDKEEDSVAVCYGKF